MHIAASYIVCRSESGMVLAHWLSWRKRAATRDAVWFKAAKIGFLLNAFSTEGYKNRISAVVSQIGFQRRRNVHLQSPMQNMHCTLESSFSTGVPQHHIPYLSIDVYIDTRLKMQNDLFHMQMSFFLMMRILQLTGECAKQVRILLSLPLTPNL